MMRRIRISIRHLLMICLLFSAGAVSAREILDGNHCSIAEDTSLTGVIFVLCEEFIMDGRIDGVLIGAVVRGQINGEVAGNVYLAGGQVDVRGTIAGDIHFAGVSLRLGNTTAEIESSDETDDTILGGNLFSVALSTRLNAQFNIPGSVIAAGYQLIIDGDVMGEVNFFGSGLTIRGTVERDVYATVGDPATDGSQIETLLLPLQFETNLNRAGLNILQGAIIRGNLEYSGPVEGNIEGRVRGTRRYTPTTIPLPTLEEPATITIYLEQFLREASTLISIGLMGMLIAPRLAMQPANNIRSGTLSSITVGMLAFILSFPIVLIMMLLSIFVLIILEVVGLRGVAIAVGVVLALVNIGGVSLFYFVAIFVARTLVGWAIGRWLMRMFGLPSQVGAGRYLSLIIGTLVLSLAAALPLIGWVFNASSLFLGLGAILRTILDRTRVIREANTATNSGVELRPVHPEVIRTALARRQTNRYLSPPPPGATNLPPGFEWSWFDD